MKSNELTKAAASGAVLLGTFQRHTTQEFAGKKPGDAVTHMEKVGVLVGDHVEEFKLNIPRERQVNYAFKPLAAIPGQLVAVIGVSLATDGQYKRYSANAVNLMDSEPAKN